MKDGTSIPTKSKWTASNLPEDVLNVRPYEYRVQPIDVDSGRCERCNGYMHRYVCIQCGNDVEVIEEEELVPGKWAHLPPCNAFDRQMNPQTAAKYLRLATLAAQHSDPTKEVAERLGVPVRTLHRALRWAKRNRALSEYEA